MTAWNHPVVVCISSAAERIRYRLRKQPSARTFSPPAHCCSPL